MKRRPMKQSYNLQRKPLRTEHDGKGFAPCSPNCPGCKAEQEELDRLGDPPPPNLDCFPRGAHHYDSGPKSLIQKLRERP